MFKSIKTLIISFLTLSSSMVADCLNLDIILTNGYREDKFSTTVRTKDLILNEHYATKHITLSPLKMYQLGGKGYYSVCGWDFRADGNFAWTTGNSGHYSETNESDPSEFNFKGKLRSAKITDFTFGSGYKICPFSYLTIIPMGGVSYQSLKAHVKHPLLDGCSDQELTNLEFNNRIKGTWVGYDVILEICSVKIRSGYEHHFSNWHGNRELRASRGSNSSSSSSCSSSSSSSSNKDRDRDFFYSRRSKGARGDVFYVDARWNFCNGFSLGCGAKLQRWKISKGIMSRIRDSDVLQDNPRKQNALKWDIFAVTADIGGHF